MFLAFGNDAGRDEQLFAMLRDMSMSRDGNAPVDITVKEGQEFEARRDVSSLRSDIAIANDSKERTRLRVKLNNLLKTLSQLKLEDNRFKYFERVDRLRARGLSTIDVCPRDESSVLLANHTTTVSRLLEIPVDRQSTDCDLRTRSYICALLGYLTNAPVATSFKDKAEDEEEKTGTNTDDRQKKRTRCLLCRTPCCDRSALTKHCRAKHTEETTFSHPFPCPECLLLGRGGVIIGGPREWSNHVEIVHGKIYTPNWYPQPASSKQPCPVCPSELTTKARLISHINRHIQSHAFAWPSSCQHCTCSKSADVYLKTKWEWLAHIQMYHMPSAHLCMLCGYLCSTSSGLTRHISAHDSDFQSPFHCPACERQGNPKTIIDGRASWHAHLIMVHGEEGYIGTSWIQTSHGGDQEKDNQRKRKRGSPQSETSTMGSTVTAGSISTGPVSISLPSSADLNTEDSDSGIPLLPPFRGSKTVATTLGVVDHNDIDEPLTAHVSLSHQATHDIPTGLLDPALQYDASPPEPMEGVITTVASSSAQSITGSEETQRVDTDDTIYAIERIVERWGRNLFLLQWVEGSHWWVHRKDILDEELVQKFEADYGGFHRGVEVIGTRTRNGKTEYRVSWTGRPSSEDTWVQEKLMSPGLVKKHKPQPKKTKKQRRY